ncbi:tail tape measure protein [Serratia phage Tsm2]|uniref:Tail tape measure protein n=1 Tax=Serratia phage Tsm2 TaxID=2787014 RepID=A0A7S9SLL8_9CAUD|nr:tail tape measure protein [Serratia phage Tsm2]QPI13745.1 tail tape measure protein [Serratia phage Tsm2]
MADTASLVARVKTEGAKQAADELNNVAGAANNADAAVQKIPKDANAAGQAMGNAAKGGFSSFKNSAQQVGFQVQDMVVQLQSGTSAFVAIGQQGSQLAGAFGPGGAVLGAVIALASAVGGVLYKSMDNAKVTAGELEEASKTLAGVLKQTSAGAFEVSDAIQTLALSGASAAEIDAKFADAQEALRTKVEASTQAVVDATKATDTWLYGTAIGAEHNLRLGDSAGTAAGFIKDLSSSLGITSDEATRLVPLLAAVQKESTPANVAALRAEVERLTKEHGNENDELRKLNSTLQQNATDTRNAKAADDALAASKANLTKRIKDQNDAIVLNQQISILADRDRAKAQAAADKEAFAKREGVTKEQVAAYNAARDIEAQQDIARIDATEKAKSERLAAAGQKRLDTQARQAETAAARQKKAADAFLAQVDRTSGDEIARITATEQQKLEQLNAFNQQGLIVGQQFEQAKTDIQLAAEDARQKELEKRRNTQARQQNEHDQFIANIQALNATEIEMIDAQNEAKLAKAKEMHDKGRISEKEYQDSIRAIQENTEKKKEEVQLAALGDMTSNLKTALGEGNALYKAAAITQTIIDTYKGATAAYSAFAGIPIVGPALGAAAAGAAIAAGLARVSAIRSAREQGGNLAPGQVSTIAERGKPEVIMPAGASRVRTAQQMRQIMGENSGGSGGDSNIVIVNQTTGRIDSVQQDRDDEGRLRVIIRELVSGDLQDSNSDISKSRRSTRGQPGH